MSIDREWFRGAYFAGMPTATDVYDLPPVNEDFVHVAEAADREMWSVLTADLMYRRAEAEFNSELAFAVAS